MLVIHEDRGLNPYVEDVARRLAIEGFLALAADALSPLAVTNEVMVGSPNQSTDRLGTMLDFGQYAAVREVGSNKRIGVALRGVAFPSADC